MTSTYDSTDNVQCKRLGNKPLVTPDMSLSWQRGGVFAPAVIHKHGQWKMLFRAYGDDAISRLGYAESKDGIKWLVDKQPRVTPDTSRYEYSGVEDPRAVNIDNLFYVTYTAFAAKAWPAATRIRILATSDFLKFRRITPHLNNFLRKNDKDGVLFPEKINNRYFMFRRINESIELSSSKSLKIWREHGVVLKPTRHDWEDWKIGAGAPPIKTQLGWLLFYHGVSLEKRYCMGVAILDPHRPNKVLYRLPYPILSPEADYEKTGVVPNVVFGTSAVETAEEYRLYYGAADNVIAAASINKHALLNALLRHPVD